MAALAVVAGVMLFPSSSQDTEAHESEAVVEAVERPPAPIATEPTPPPHPADVPLPSLPLLPNISPRPAEVITAAYEFAARNPDVLEYVPCFCGCESFGHTGNASCFVKERDANGAVREWEPHGMGCMVCIDVARRAEQLHASGASVQDIRTAVEAQYETSPVMTPTPAPPAE
jgi:hypothetical protein